MFDPEEFFNTLDDSDRESCWESIGEYGEDADEPSIFVLNISESSLRELDFENAEMTDFADLGCWDALEGVLSKEDLEMHKTDFKDVSSFVILLYCDGKYVTSSQGE